MPVAASWQSTWQASDLSKPKLGDEKTIDDQPLIVINRPNKKGGNACPSLTAPLSAPRPELTWRKLTGRRKKGDTDKFAATRKKRNEAALAKHDDDERAAKRRKALVENDCTEANHAARVQKNLKDKLAKRKKVKEQRRAFKDRSNALLAEFPDDVRKACIIHLKCIQCLASNSRIHVL